MSLPFLNYLKNEVKTEIKIKIFKEEFKQEDLHQFSEKDLKKAIWTEDNEFTLNHYFYDVVSTKTINGQKVYYCFQDKKETKITKIETKIQDFFANPVLKQAKVKPYYSITVKINKIAKEADKSLLFFSKNHFSKSQFQSYQLSIKNSEFIEKLVIPPEV